MAKVEKVENSDSVIEKKVEKKLAKKSKKSSYSKKKRIKKVHEKPNRKFSGLGVTGMYLFDSTIINKVNKINNIEKKVLIEMLANPGKTYSRTQIREISNIVQERSIDVMITRLRQKIELKPKNPKYLQTIRGSGYVLWVE